jgi:hypothetical protein
MKEVKATPKLIPAAKINQNTALPVFKHLFLLKSK